MGERTTVENLYLYDPQFEPAAKKFLAENPTKNAIQEIKSADDIKSAAAKYGGVKLLLFDTHGGPAPYPKGRRKGLRVEFCIPCAGPRFLSPGCPNPLYGL